jgi:hypothetical protein
VVQLPTLHSVLSCNLNTALHYMNSAFDEITDMVDYQLGAPYTWGTKAQREANEATQLRAAAAAEAEATAAVTSAISTNAAATATAATAAAAAVDDAAPSRKVSAIVDNVLAKHVRQQQQLHQQQQRRRRQAAM